VLGAQVDLPGATCPRSYGPGTSAALKRRHLPGKEYALLYH